MNLLNKYVVVLALIAVCPVASFGQQYTAAETVENGVKELLTTVQDSRELFNTDRESYFGIIEEVLSSIVAFNAVAEVVMNRYAASASDTQKDRFAEILKQTLTRFYGASLVDYDGQEISFLPPRNADADPRADTVVGMELGNGDTKLGIP